LLAVQVKSNATAASPTVFECQHGPEECEGNRVEMCALTLHGMDRWFPFTVCFERYFPATRNASLTAASCAGRAEVDALEILDCAAGPRGAELEARAFARTQALIPPHTFVPWVVVNGEPACGGADGCDSVPITICQLYTGPKPEACAAILANASAAVPPSSSVLRFPSGAAAAATKPKACMRTPTSEQEMDGSAIQ